MIDLALTRRRAEICGDDWTEELKYPVLKYPVCLGNKSISASLKETDGDSGKKEEKTRKHKSKSLIHTYITIHVKQKHGVPGIVGIIWM